MYGHWNWELGPLPMKYVGIYRNKTHPWYTLAHTHTHIQLQMWFSCTLNQEQTFFQSLNIDAGWNRNLAEVFIYFWNIYPRFNIYLIIFLFLFHPTGTVTDGEFSTLRTAGEDGTPTHISEIIKQARKTVSTRADSTLKKLLIKTGGMVDSNDRVARVT